jgi:tight adherence protein C
MMSPPLLWAAVLIGGIGVAGSAVMLAHLRRERRVWQRLHGMRGNQRRQPAAGGEGGALLLRWVAALGGAVARSGALSQKTLNDLEQTLIASGLRTRNGIGLFIGSKVLLLGAVPVLLLLLLPGFGFSKDTTHTIAAIGAAMGMLLPDMTVRRIRRSYLERVDRGLSDALDMMVICAQAGLGLETAMQRVAVEIMHAHPDVARELEATLSEMRITVDSQRAIINLGVRTGLPSLKRISSTLAQTLQFGTPLTDALRVLSAEMRQETLVKFEARAARLPVLLTLPMIMFIFPCIFIVIAGPAALQIMKAFGH